MGRQVLFHHIIAFSVANAASTRHDSPGQLNTKTNIAFGAGVAGAAASSGAFDVYVGVQRRVECQN
jgi:hypothetical protein